MLGRYLATVVAIIVIIIIVAVAIPVAIVVAIVVVVTFPPAPTPFPLFLFLLLLDFFPGLWGHCSWQSGERAAFRSTERDCAGRQSFPGPFQLLDDNQRGFRGTVDDVRA